MESALDTLMGDLPRLVDLIERGVMIWKCNSCRDEG